MKRFLTLLPLFLVLWTGGAFAACSADRVTLRNDYATVRFDVELAVTPQERSQGLMFRETLPNRSGMLFVFDPPQRVAFWMKNTLIPLDMIFLDRTGLVTRVHEGAIPGDLTPIEGGDSVFAVLEINAGLSARYSITPGTQMQHEIFSSGPAIWPC
ncbi:MULTISPECIES: DUF192 domain-containing protein [unclassified Ruegeria]|uniref:DUF192 domain-containing protein n=1 Tax=unclassified Ruegeria TaxID=2625375 RepID=UPI0014899F0D|nr:MULTISPECIES: DUF192 domain-containing protein [unclassified Ruegeria]NOD75519.1 DUF192 domain-containing protein [Ruegeria sp. HKCCD4332]NOD87501.1 DUF192 domain-containing protein [Ruegeria sp. HKCCD4318]NOE13056.1 DUF192 domain-containing protein [Ruegeria sp. HKCCD4318-2]NOG08776.1 DUF192 domain-containing protein [Ruegeria sp. HKCCD4315]